MDNFVRVFRDWWMSRWSMHDINLIVGYDTGWTENEITTYFLTVYSISGFTIIGFTAARTIIIQVVGLGAAKKLHEKMLWRLLKSPVSFFDQVTTPAVLTTTRLSEMVLRGRLVFGSTDTCRSDCQPFHQ